MSDVFAEARAAAARLQELLTHRRSPEEVHLLLRERATRLAARHDAGTGRKAVLEVVMARRGATSWAVPVTAVDEIRVVTWTPLPRGANGARALFSVRGRVLALVDPAGWVTGAAEVPLPDKVLALLLRTPWGSLGLAVDEALGVRTLFEDEMDDRVNAADLPRAAAVTRDLVVVLDVAAPWSSAVDL